MKITDIANTQIKAWAPFQGSKLSTAALRTWGPKIPALLDSVGLDLHLRDGYVPLPGLYAIMSGAGGGKTTLCRQLDQHIRDMKEADGPEAAYAFVRVGEPEDPIHAFETTFPQITKLIASRQQTESPTGTDAPLLLIVDSLTDLAFQELPRAPRTTLEQMNDAMADTKIFGTESLEARAPLGGLLDLALSRPTTYFAPNTAAMSGGLTGSYYQLLKRLSVACTHQGVYMLAVINPLTFDDRAKFRQAVLGSCTAAVSIDQFDAGLVRCVRATDDTVNYADAARLPIANRRVSATSADVQDLFTSLLNGGDNV